MPLKNPPVPLPIPSYDALRFLKAALNVFVAERQTLDDPRDLTEKTTAQTGFYKHRGLDEQASSIRPGVFTPDTPPPAGYFPSPLRKGVAAE
jgi:hypothetical protein